MSYRLQLWSAFVALAVGACAHSPGSLSRSTSGERAAQPFGWPETVVSDPAPRTVLEADATLANRSVHGFAWPAQLQSPRVEASVRPRSDRATQPRTVQPFGWPEQLADAP